MPRFLQSAAAGLLGLGLLVAVMYGDLLFLGNGRVLSQPGTDLTAGEADGRAILFEALRKGEIPQWNPHLFSGIPMLGELQSGVLYPANLILLPFSLPTALNLHVAIHVWILGAGMLFWIRHRGLHPMAAFAASGIVMFAGPVALHIYAGHWMNLAAMSWAPFLFLAADLIFDGRLRKGILLGSACMALQLMTGQAQYAYYTGIALGIYSLLRIVTEPHRIRSVAALAAFGIGGVSLASVQLLPGLLNLGEGARGGKGVDFEFAAMFSFPPENVLTLLAPGFFGNMTAFPYWGRCYLWEMCIFLSITGFALGIFGLVKGTPVQRRWSGVMAGILFILALGSHTPLFRVLFDYAPGFKSLRGNSKFIFPALLFSGMLVATGLHSLSALSNSRRPLLFGVSALAGAFLVISAGVAISLTGGDGWWHEAMLAVYNTRECYVPESFYNDRSALAKAAAFSSSSFYWAGAALSAAGLILIVPVATRTRIAFLGALALIEVFAFARTARVSFNLDAYRKDTGQTAIRDFLKTQTGDFRILQITEPNSSMFLKAQNIWGYGAIPSRRYLEFIAFTQGVNPDEANQYINFRQFPEIYRILRCRFGFVPDGNELKVLAMADPLERIQLVENFEVLPGRDEIFQRLTQPGFDPRKTALLESSPGFSPSGTGHGTAKITRSSRDFLEIEADLSDPGILLITDPYSLAWSAKAIHGSKQNSYQIVPANYVLMGIPMEAGHHHFRLDCVAPGYQPGRWITALAALAWIGLFAWPRMRTSGIFTALSTSRQK